MTGRNRRCSSFGAAMFVFFTGSLLLAQEGGAAGEGSGGAAGADAAGEGGSTAVGPGIRLGRACVTDQNCQDADTPNLQCITATETVLGNGAPPHGLCTSPCLSDDDCTALSAGSLCFPFNEDADSGYCLEGCSFGEPDIGESKCHGRDDFACNPALLGGTTEPCTTFEDCGSGELCVDNVCNVVFPACMPSCRGDLDCAQGMYCDQSFLSGVCVAQKPLGKGLGEPCTVTDEPDECLGFCQADAEGSQQGRCSTNCGIGAGCAWNPESERFDGGCFYASVLTAETGGIGDFGFCTPSCNCTDECGDPALECQDAGGIGRLPSDFRGPGLCFAAESGATLIQECDSGQGGAGAGGETSSSGGETTSSGGETTSSGGETTSSGGETTSSGGETTSSGGETTSSGGGTSGAGGPNGPTDGGDTHDANGGSRDDSGCGCKLTPQHPRAAGALWLLPLLGLLLRRRRAERSGPRQPR